MDVNVLVGFKKDELTYHWSHVNPEMRRQAHMLDNEIFVTESQPLSPPSLPPSPVGPSGVVSPPLSPPSLTPSPVWSSGVVPESPSLSPPSLTPSPLGSGGVVPGRMNIAHIDGLEQERRNSSALAMELRLSCTKPSIFNSLLLAPRCNNILMKALFLGIAIPIIKTKQLWDRFIFMPIPIRPNIHIYIYRNGSLNEIVRRL